MVGNYVESQIVLFENNYGDGDMTWDVIFWNIFIYLLARFIKYRV